MLQSCRKMLRKEFLKNVSSKKISYSLNICPQEEEEAYFLNNSWTKKMPIYGFVPLDSSQNWDLTQLFKIDFSFQTEQIFLFVENFIKIILKLKKNLSIKIIFSNKLNLIVIFQSLSIGTNRFLSSGDYENSRLSHKYL